MIPKKTQAVPKKAQMKLLKKVQKKVVTRRVSSVVGTSDSSMSSDSRNNSSLGSRIIISLIAVVLLVVMGVFVQHSLAGKAIEIPQEAAVNYNVLDSELIAVSVGHVDLNVTASGVGQRPIIYNLSMELVDHDYVSYVLRKKGGTRDIIVQGLLGRNVLSMGGVYIDNDEIPDLSITLEGPYLRVTNLNYVSPEAATITRVDNTTFVMIRDTVIPSSQGQMKGLMFFVNSTKKPAVSAVWANGSDVVEAVNIGGNDSSVILAINWTPTIGRGSMPFTIIAAVDQEVVRKNYVFAVGGVEYALLNNDQSVRLEMFRDNGVLKAHYTLAASGGLQPLMAPCGGFPLLSTPTLADKIERVLTFASSTQQWTNRAPSEFQNLRFGRGYLVKLKEGQSLDVTYPCSEGDPNNFELPQLRSGWNLISFGGTEIRDGSMLEPPVGTQIRLVFEVTPSRIIPDVPLDTLEPGKVYWVKVQ